MILGILLLTASAVGQQPCDRAPHPFTRETLWRSFPADIRDMVYRWDPDDPRTEDQRRRALFDFMYEGFESAAWVPQSLFKRKELPAPFGDPGRIISQTIGLVAWPQSGAANAYGMAPELVPGRSLAWTANCVTCHITEIDGVVYFGGGGKLLDETLLKLAVLGLTDARWRTKLLDDAEDDRLAAETHRIMRTHRYEPMDPITRGRSTAFAASHVEMYLRSHNICTTEACRPSGICSARQTRGRGSSACKQPAASIRSIWAKGSHPPTWPASRRKN